jgi:hypothetical protein
MTYLTTQHSKLLVNYWLYISSLVGNSHNWSSTELYGVLNTFELEWYKVPEIKCEIFLSATIFFSQFVITVKENQPDSKFWGSKTDVICIYKVPSFKRRESDSMSCFRCIVS